MNGFAKICLAVALFSALVGATDNQLMESTKADKDVPLTTDPVASFWRSSRPVYAEKDTYGKPLPRYRTEIRSRWTKNNLYFLFICPYEMLHLKPSPHTKTETFQLWDWDVAEVFIGSDFQNIRHYKEFEVSPRGEWIDLDIDLSKPHHEEGWKWNSGFQVATRVDHRARIWYAAMRIPVSAIDQNPPGDGNKFRVNLFRSQGPDHKLIVWQPTMSDTFHVPERFGILKLVEQQSPAKAK
jgi:hypothetical protein